MDKHLKKKSKFLSLVLRHNPGKIGIELDGAGWTDVKTLLRKAGISMSLLEEVVETNNKNRFEFSDNKTKIRARQGHSVNVSLGYEPVEPPEYLYHGTATRFIDTIIKKGGLKPMNRHHVHMSPDEDTAGNVGTRHGVLAMLRVKAGELAKAGAKFYKTDNNVWLTDSVPPEYLQRKVRHIKDGDFNYVSLMNDGTFDVSFTVKEEEIKYEDI
jgi:putative RNA 2'-phosphotransferase